MFRLFALFLTAVAAKSLLAGNIEETPTDRVIQYAGSTGDYTLWDSDRTTLPVGGIGGGRETRAVLKFDFDEEWRSSAGTAASVTLELTLTSRTGDPFEIEVVALEENFATPVRTGDYRAAGKRVWGPVSTGDLSTGGKIAIDVTDPVRRMALRGEPAAFRIQNANTVEDMDTNNAVAFGGANNATRSRRPLLAYALRSPLATVDPVEPGTISPGDLSFQEQNIADYIGTVSRLANNVEDEDPATYGFITGDLWRVPRNGPYNARVQENAMTMGWFYATDRPWNPYYGDEALRHRMEAALAYLITLQKDDGHFPEFPPEVEQTGNHKRAPTAFVIYYIAHLLPVLDEGPGLNDDLRAELVAAAERAAYWILNEETDVWTTGRWVSNQLPPGLIAIHLLQDEFTEDFQALWDQRLSYMKEHAQSPAGFFYESYHVGHNYSFSVMTRDLAQLYKLTGDSRVLEMQEKYIEWLGYNFIPEPDGTGFFINSAVDARHNGFNHFKSRDVGTNNLWSQWIPAARAFGPALEEIEQQREAFLQSNWDGTDGLTRWVSPSVMVDIEYPEHYPAEAEREAAIAALPPVKEERFTEFRKDGHREFLFVRRPGYYVAANLGNRNTGNQRMGLSLFWHPQTGMLIQSQDTDNVSWSVIHSGDLGSAEIDADGNLPAAYHAGNKTIDPATLADDDEFSFTYTGKAGSKQVSFHDEGIERNIEGAGEFREQVPLVVRPDDRLTWLGSDQEISFGQWMRNTTASGLRLEREGYVFRIEWDETLPVQFGAAPNGSLFDGERRLHRLILFGEDQLRYSLRVSPIEHAFDAWRSKHFSGDELADSEISGPGAAPAGDDISNAIKYFLGLDPWEPARGKLPRAYPDEEYLTMRFKRSNETGGLSWDVEVSSDAKAWNSGPEYVAVSETAPSGGKVEVTARDREPLRANNRRFMRLVLTANDSGLVF